MVDESRLSGRTAGTLDRDETERLRELVQTSMTAEFATQSDGKPVTYPIMPFYDPDAGRLIVSSPPAFANKIERVKRNPKVSLLVGDTEVAYLIQGKGHVREDDPADNGEYIRRLMETEPESDKRRANESAVKFLESKVGRFLMRWYALRLVVEIEPLEMTPLGDSLQQHGLAAWPAIDMPASEADRYDRAIFTFVGDDGYPVSSHLESVEFDADGAVIETQPSRQPAEGQPACLLFHWHGDTIDRLGQRLVLGRCHPAETDAIRFVPGSSTTHRQDGLLDTLRFIINGKRRTRDYFRRR